MAPCKSSRRNIILAGVSAVGALAATLAHRTTRVRPTPTQFATAPSQTTHPPLSEPTNAREQTTPDTLARGTMPQRTLGRTGLSLPVLGLGGSASPLSRPGAEAEAIAIIERSLALGVQYFDTAANYGPSEERLGQVLPGYRDQVVIGSKTSRRDRDGAWAQLETNLKRLNTDYLDIWQFHALTHGWDIDTILDRQSGAILAAEEAREQGVIGAIGITGHHNPDIITQALQRYPFDTALIPINAADIHTPTPFITHILPMAQSQNVGIIAMKVPAYGRLFKPGVLSGMAEAMGYVLSQSGVHCCIIAAETIAQLEENVQVAQGFQPMPTDNLADIEQRTTSVWRENSFFRSWG
ncbi:MAG: aldo/keto reductase [Leptolyngbyaceae bacterium]|nr:aldo/keto reductase [Leptolyngbyaceae bacterium]